MSMLIPHLVCPTAAQAIDWYKKIFHAEEVTRMPMPDGRLMHAELKIAGDSLMLCDDFPEHCGGKSSTPAAIGGTSIVLNIITKDCDTMVNAASAAGANVTMPPTDMFWGDRYAQFTDPFGHKWAIVQHLKVLTKEEIQANMKAAFSGPKK